MERDAVMVAGFGWREGATPDSLRAALMLALRQLPAPDSSPQSVKASGPPSAPAPDHTDTTLPGPLTLLATAQDKASATCLQALATQLGLPVHAVPLALLKAVPTATRSVVVHRLRGSGSVAEAAALAAAAEAEATQMPIKHSTNNARLLHPRSVSPDRLATCALATFDPLPERLP